MKKVIYKLFFAWNFEKEEQWLNEMASKGLVLTYAGLGKYEFEECEFINPLSGQTKEQINDNNIDLYKKSMEGDMAIFKDNGYCINSYFFHINFIWSSERFYWFFIDETLKNLFYLFNVF